MTGAPQNLTIAELVQTYHTWVRDRTQLKSVRQWTEITTPFLDRHNDYVQIYASRTDLGGFVLTDDAHTINDLELSGLSLESPKRKEILGTTLNGFGVTLTDGALEVHATAENFSIKKHNLIQSILAVNDMFSLASTTVKSLFLEEIESWLDSNAIRHLSRVKLSGASGFDHVFDFAVPKSTDAPERLLKAITNPNRDSAQSFAFAWIDTKPARQPNAIAYAFINDNERRVPSSVIEAFASYNINSILWSQREPSRQLLTA